MVPLLFSPEDAVFMIFKFNILIRQTTGQFPTLHLSILNQLMPREGGAIPGFFFFAW